jgi:hypothetical protein
MTTEPADSGQTKYDTLAKQWYGKMYWQLNQDQRIEIIDLWNERNT